VDVGDADPLYTDLEYLDRSVAAVIGRVLAAGRQGNLPGNREGSPDGSQEGDGARSREADATESPAARWSGDPLDRLLDAIPRDEPIYISLDIDGLDPAVAPGTSSPEPGGLTYEEVQAILLAVGARARVVGLGIVEVNPYLDPGGATVLLGARLAIEAMALAFRPAGSAQTGDIQSGHARSDDAQGRSNP